MTLHRPVPSDVDAECLADLLADVRAIPTAALAQSRIVIPDDFALQLIPQERALDTLDPTRIS